MDLCSHTPPDPKKLSPFSVQSIVDLLRAEGGLRITPARIRILEVLIEADGPLSLEEICERSQNGKIRPDYSTVFRMMTLLENLKLAQKVNLLRSSSYYELRNPERHYDHVVCTNCGKVLVITEPCPLGKLEESISRRYRFRNITHSLEFFGLCESCSS